jgi:alpha-L-rhamnosidase
MTLVLNHPISGQWRASYAWSADWGGPGLTVRRFRRRFVLSRVPERFLAYVSADSRYRLWVNGEPVGRGPLKGTLRRYHYEVYDLASYLQPGDNVIAAEAHWFGQHAPTSEVHSRRPGFLFQGPEDATLDTPVSWRVLADRAVEPDNTPYISNAHRFLGYWEIVNGEAYPRGWIELSYDDVGWEVAVDTGPADVPGLTGTSHPLQTLCSRDVPMLIEEPRRFVRTLQDGQEREHLFGEDPLGWTLEAGRAGEIVLDAGSLTTGYPELSFSGGAGRKVEVIYGECVLRWGERQGRRVPVKGLRDDIASGEVHGYRDTITLPGGSFCYEPFHWRTFWFVRIVVSAGNEPFTLEDVRYRFTTYPQTLQATFDSAIPDTEKMWEVSWRSLQLCAHETYEDCPYYEQLNYIADSRLQALCSLVLAGETELPKRTIRLFRDSVRPDGLVHSRVPSAIPQILPYFALIWVLMVEDYWRWVGRRERAFVRSTLNVVDSVLWFFRERLRDNGFVGQIPPWSMVDRVPGWTRGEPPAVVAGASTYLTCLYVYALDTAIRLHSEAGEPGDADRWRPLAERVRLAVREQAWSEREGLFLEGPGRTEDGLSQHSQVAAILADVATPKQTRRILERLTSDRSLFRMKFMQSFYLARALEKAGSYSAFSTHVLELWRQALAKHVSTWPEYPDPTRSDCHAWSSWIAADFVTCVLGIRPLKPGFAGILIAPHTEIGAYARGSAPTAVGTVTVEWRKDPDTGIVHLQASAPEGAPTVVRLPGLEPVRYASGGSISLSSEGN